MLHCVLKKPHPETLQNTFMDMNNKYGVDMNNYYGHEQFVYFCNLNVHCGVS